MLDDKSSHMSYNRSQYDMLIDRGCIGRDSVSLANKINKQAQEKVIGDIEMKQYALTKSFGKTHTNSVWTWTVSWSRDRNAVSPRTSSMSSVNGAPNE